MRKFSLALLAMIMVTAMAFAAPIGTEWTLEAEASATFGVNLDQLTDGTGYVTGPTTGFQVATDIDLEIEFIEEQTAEFGEGETYGWIEVEDFELVLEFQPDDSETTTTLLDGTNGELTGKVFFGPAYLLVATAGNDVNIAGDVGLNVDESILGVLGGGYSVAGGFFKDADLGTSVAVGFNLAEMVDIEVAIASYSGSVTGQNGTYISTATANDWSDNIFNNYVAALYSEIAATDELTVSVDVAMTLRAQYPDETETDGEYSSTDSCGDAGDDLFLAVGAEYEMPLNEVMTAVPYLGLDFDNNAGDSQMEVYAGANITWGADDLEVFNEASDETEEGVGIEVGYISLNDGTNEDAGTIVRLGFAESGGDDGYFPVIGGAALVEYVSLDGDTIDGFSAWAFGAELSADLGEIEPYFGLMTADKEDFTGFDSGMTMQVGTDICIIPNVTFTIDYVSGDLNNDDDGWYDTNQYTYAAALGEATSKSGLFTIKTKIEY
jgi:hypothetical protein